MTTRTTSRSRTAGADLREDRPGANPVAQRETAAERGRREELMELRNLAADRVDQMQKMMPQMEPWLRQAGLSPEAFISAFRLAMAKSPKIARCTPASLILACMDCARVGLQPDGEKGALVPFKNRENGGQLEATFIPMYKGYLDIIYRTGLISAVTCQAVFEGEDDPAYLRYSIGDDPFVDFSPPINRDETKKIVAAFATAKAMSGGGKWVEVIGEKGLQKISAVNKAEGVGKNWPSEMARKAPLRRMIKFLPKHPDLDALNAIEARAYQSLPSERDKRRLSDDALLNDTPEQVEDQSGAPTSEEQEAALVTDEEVEVAQAPMRFVAMLEQAFDAETLESRAELIHLDQVYVGMDAAEKALIDMTLRQQREAFGLDPETGEVAP